MHFISTGTGNALPLLLPPCAVSLIALCLPSLPQVMFDFVGKVMVLQPQADASFVARSERPHPMLPAQPGLFVLREPTPMSTVAGESHIAALAGTLQVARTIIKGTGDSCSFHPAIVSKVQRMTNLFLLSLAYLPAATLQQDAGFVRDAVNHAISNLPAAVAAAAAGADGIATPPPAAAAVTALVPAAATSKAASKAGNGSGKGAAKASKPRPPVRSAREAALELMNVPHPLDILADAGAYGSDGAISRYHNPDNCELTCGRRAAAAVALPGLPCVALHCARACMHHRPAVTRCMLTSVPVPPCCRHPRSGWRAASPPRLAPPRQECRCAAVGQLSWYWAVEPTVLGAGAHLHLHLQDLWRTLGGPHGAAAVVTPPSHPAFPACSQCGHPLLCTRAGPRSAAQGLQPCSPHPDRCGRSSRPSRLRCHPRLCR